MIILPILLPPDCNGHNILHLFSLRVVSLDFSTFAPPFLMMCPSPRYGNGDAKDPPSITSFDPFPPSFSHDSPHRAFALPLMFVYSSVSHFELPPPRRMIKTFPLDFQMRTSLDPGRTGAPSSIPFFVCSFAWNFL